MTTAGWDRDTFASTAELRETVHAVSAINRIAAANLTASASKIATAIETSLAAEGVPSAERHGKEVAAAMRNLADALGIAAAVANSVVAEIAEARTARNIHARRAVTQ